MDRYEYNVKSDQIKKLYGKKDYAAAAEIADEIDWSRVKNNGMLAMVADVYEGTKQYDKARDVLEIAYERSPLGRQLAYRLTIISLRMRDFVAADEYYQDFVELAPRDVAQYILKYRIARAKGEDLSVLISILEAYADVEMDERWQYELAKLYHEAEQADKCVEMCDKIILWFSEGKYVTKAMELKMKHEPLTEEQQAKYDGKWDYYNEKIKTEEIADSVEEATSGQAEDISEKAQENEEETEQDSREEVSLEENKEISEEESKESGGEAQEEKWPQTDILNDTTALDYLTDYSEEEKLIKEPEEPQLDEETAMEVEQQLAKIVEESVESARNEIEDTIEDEKLQEPETSDDMQEEESDIETVFEEENQETEEDSFFEEEKQDIEDMDDAELIAEAYTSEEESNQEEETDEDDKEDDVEEDEEIVMESEDVIEEEPAEEETIEEETTEKEIEAQPESEQRFSPDNKIEIFEFDESKSGKMKNIGEELMKTAEIDINEINLQVNSSDSAVYDTANIQEALAKSMKIILQAESEKATRNAFAESEVMDEPTKRIDKEDEDNIKEVTQQPEQKKPVYETVPLQPIYDKEEDGQIKIFQPVEAEEQIDGQMNMEDVLLEFEKQKREALEEAARREEEARETARRAAEEAAAARAAVEKAMAEEAAARAALEKAARTQQFLQNDNILPNFKDNNIEIEMSDTVLEPERQAEEMPDIVQPIDNISLEETNDMGAAAQTEQKIESESDISKETQEDITEEKADENGPKLSDEDKKMFVDFLDIMGLEEQIAATLDNLVNHFVQDGTSKTNNVMVMGDAKSGKTTLALGIIKAANKGRGRNGRKVAKVKATALNKKGISAAMSQILGTDLIIEQAGNLMPGTVVDLIAAMKAYTEEMIIVLEDDKAALERLVTANPILEDIFNNQISIKEFEINDFVKIAKEYAQSKQYIVDEMGTLALYAKIDDISGKNQGISRSDIYEIIDNAIVHAERFKISRLIGKIKRTHYEMGVLKEEDFN